MPALKPRIFHITYGWGVHRGGPYAWYFKSLAGACRYIKTGKVGILDKVGTCQHS